MSYSTSPRIATIVFAIVIFFFGLNHLIIPEVVVKEVPSFFPAPVLWVYVTGVAQILAAIALVLNKQVRLAGYLLAAMIVVIALVVHLNEVFNASSQEQQKIEVIFLAKDIAIAAAAFFIGSKNE
jgi:uncharacterized membrane protein